MEKDDTSQAQESGRGFREVLLRASVGERTSTLARRFRREIAKALNTCAENVSTDAPFSCLNPDWSNPDTLVPFLFSLIRSDLALPIYLPELRGQASIRALSEYIAKELELPPAPENFATVVDPFEKGSYLLRIAAKPPTGAKRNPGIVFILCSPRTGSTLLRVMLAGHARLFAPPELNLLPFESMGERGRQIDETGLSWMRYGPGTAFAYLEGLTPEQVDQRLSQLEEDDVPVQQVYAMLQELAGDRLLVDKSPAYTGHLGILQRAEQLFEGSKYLHLVRHPCGAIESFARMSVHEWIGETVDFWDENPWLFAEKVWDAQNIHILDFLRDIEPSRQHRVLYEELVSDPSGVLQGICDFLGLPFDEAVLRPYDGDRMRGVGDGNTYYVYNRVDLSLATAWKKRPPPQRLGEVTRRLCQEFGYEIPDDN